MNPAQRFCGLLAKTCIICLGAGTELTCVDQQITKVGHCEVYVQWETTEDMWTKDCVRPLLTASGNPCSLPQSHH